MKKTILLLILFMSFFAKNHAQNYAIVNGSYRNTLHTDTLNGKNIQFSQNFLDSIEKFQVISYRQSYPNSKKK